MPRQKQNNPPHPCANPNCGNMTTRPRFCCRDCEYAANKRRRYRENTAAIAAGYAHAGTEITPIDPAIVRQFADYNRRQEEARQAARANALAFFTQRREIAKICTPGEFRNDEDYFPKRVPVPRFGFCAKCGERRPIEGSRYCHKCQGNIQK